MRQLFILLTACVLLGACAAPEPVQPIPEFTLVPSSTPPMPASPADDIFADLPAGRTPQGFPTLGEQTAPVTVREYGSYDSVASGNAFTEILPTLLPRIRAGEVYYVYVPLTGTGTLSDGLSRGRGALCAGEQNAFWTYHAALFGGQMADISGEQQIEALGLTPTAWSSCVLSDRPNRILQAAAAEAAELDSYAGTPTYLVNGNFVLPDPVSIDTIVQQMLERVDEAGGIAALPTPQLDPDATEEMGDPRAFGTPVELPSTIQQALTVPIELNLPPDWEQTLNDTLLLNDIDAVRTIPFTLWRGPVAGGATGSIALLWGFPNVTTGNMMAAEMGLAMTPVPNLRVDGSRLLRLAVVEQGCNVGTDLEREYVVGGRTGTGTAWSAVDCPELSDTRGWFVGVREQGLNFLFYAYVEPIDPTGVTSVERDARAELQAILDSVVFRQVDTLPTPEMPLAQITATPE